MQGRSDQPTRKSRSEEAHAPSRQAPCTAGTRPLAKNSTAAPFLDRLRGEIGDKTYERYIGKTARVSLDDSALRLTLPNRFAADMIDARFGPAIRRALSACGKTRHHAVCFDVDPKSGEECRRPSPARRGGKEPLSAPARPARRRRPRQDGHTLDTFVVGQCNRLAFETARRVAESNETGLTCPFFLYGPCGVGKTHLLAAVAERYAEVNPGARTRFVTAESFTNEYVNAVRSSTIEAFHRAYRRIELLCIDDIHYLAKKNGTQNELLHTFDTLDFGGARIVLASDAHPRQIKQFSRALISRFVSGSLVRIDPPDRTTATRLVRHFATKRGLTIDDAAAHILAESATPPSPGAAPSARDLHGAVNRALAYTRMAKPGSEPVIDTTLAIAAVRHDDTGHTSPDAHPATYRPVPIDRVIDAVCAALAVTRQDLAGRGRHKSVVLARAMIALLARRLTKRSYPEIATAIGRSNHSTVITAHHRIEGQIERGESVAVGLHIDGTPIAILTDQLERTLRVSS